jgi:hypothetical protein
MSTRDQFVEAMKREVEDRRRTEQAQHDRAEAAEQFAAEQMGRAAEWQHMKDDALARVADLEAGIRERIEAWNKAADRAADLGDFGRAASYGPFIDSLRALVGDETPGTARPVSGWGQNSEGI